MSHVSVQTVEYPATPAGNGSFRLSELRVDNSRRLPFTAGGWCIFVARSGGGEFMEPLRSYPFCEKEVVILRPGARCVIGVSDSPELVADFFHFHPEELVGLLHLDERILFDRLSRQPAQAHVLAASCELARRFRAMAGRLAEPGTLEHRCQLLQLLGPILGELRLILERLEAKSSEVADRIFALLNGLSDAELQNLSVEDLAQRCNCSRRHLSRLVRQRLGISIVGLKTQLRLERAAALLQDPEAKVIEVAYQCGFSHAGAFSARFKERFGTTPAKWRMKMVGSRNGASGTNGHSPANRPGKTPFSRI